MIIIERSIRLLFKLCFVLVILSVLENIISFVVVCRDA